MAECWHLYLLECQNRNGRLSYYAGITTDLQRRYAEHASGNGARYTRANPPLRMVASKPFADRSSALKAEAALKKAPRDSKLGFFKTAS